MWNLENGGDELICKAELGPTVIENKLMVPQRDADGKLLLTYIRIMYKIVS